MVCHQPCVFLGVSAKGDSEKLGLRHCRIPWDEAIGGIPHRHTHTHQVSHCQLYIYIHHTYICIYKLHILHIYIYQLTIYIYPIIQIPIFVGVGVPMGSRVPPFGKIPVSCPHLSISVPNISCAFRVFACASAQRAVKAACIGRIWREFHAFQGVHVRSSKSFLGI